MYPEATASSRCAGIQAMSRAALRRAKRLEFKDIFEALNEYLKLDLVCKKLLSFLSKSGRTMAPNEDRQSWGSTPSP